MRQPFHVLTRQSHDASCKPAHTSVPSSATHSRSGRAGGTATVCARFVAGWQGSLQATKQLVGVPAPWQHARMLCTGILQQLPMAGRIPPLDDARGTARCRQPGGGTSSHLTRVAWSCRRLSRSCSTDCQSQQQQRMQACTAQSLPRVAQPRPSRAGAHRRSLVVCQAKPQQEVKKGSLGLELGERALGT